MTVLRRTGMLTGHARDTRCRLPSLTVLRAASMVCMVPKVSELRVRICRRQKAGERLLLDQRDEGEDVDTACAWPRSV